MRDTLTTEFSAYRKETTNIQTSKSARGARRIMTSNSPPRDIIQSSTLQNKCRKTRSKSKTNSNAYCNPAPTPVVVVVSHGGLDAFVPSGFVSQVVPAKASTVPPQTPIEKQNNHSIQLSQSCLIGQKGLAGISVTIQTTEHFLSTLRVTEQPNSRHCACPLRAHPPTQQSRRRPQAWLTD